MKWTFIVIAELFIWLNVFSQAVSNDFSKALQVIKKYHVNPPAVDDSLSKKIFYQYFQLVDPDKIIFTTEDIDQLKVFEFKIDDELKTGNLDFVKQTQQLLLRKIPEVEQKIKTILSIPLDFSKSENVCIHLFNYPSSFASDKDFDNWLEKWMKFKVLTEMAVPVVDDSINYNVSIKLKDQELVRKQVLRKQTRQLEYLLNNPDLIDYLSVLLLKALATSCDPHTDYFTGKDLSRFEEALSPETMSFGFYIDENQQGEIEIIRLLPGGPSWKSNKLNKGDVILGIQWENEKEQDLSDYDVQNIDVLLKRPDKTKATLKIRKKNGSIINVELQKAKISAEENVVKAYVLKGPKKIGYISLPDFYSDYENTYRVGCANDVAKEIIKLNKEKIDGIILDLRDNGGGSLQEALDLSGIFIDYGPVAMMSDNTGKTDVLKDLNRGSIYNGPLLILINGQSASASEVFAAAMQNYHRAIIAGGPSFGKATSQVVIPCDSSHTKTDTKNQSGFLKITVGEIYNVKGSSHQQTGIIPDIPINPSKNIFNYNEAALDNSLKISTTSKQSYYKPLPELPIQELKQKSSERTANQINKNGYSVTYNDNKDLLVPLNIDEYKQFLKAIYLGIYNPAIAKNTETPNFSATSSEFNNLLNNFNSDSREIFESHCISIQRDYEIQEAYNILIDYVGIIQKP
jgi:carboxyl-terminal processing protease